MESEILRFICANQGAVDTEFLVCNLGYSVSEILSSSDKFVPCCPFGQPTVVARTKVKLCRTRNCPDSCRELHLCKSFLFSGSCQFTLTGRGCFFSHTLESAHNGQILEEHGLEHLSRAQLCTLLLQSDDRLLPRICHDYNTGDGVFGGCKHGLACKRLHVCERYLHLNCRCSRNHDFGVPHTLSLLKGMPWDLSWKSVYANIQALKYHDIQSNKAKSGNQKLQGNRGNRGQRGWGRGHVKKPADSADAKADGNKSADCDGQVEGDDEQEQQQPAEGAFTATEIWANSCEGPLQVVTPWPQSPAKHQEPSEGGVATQSMGDNHQQLPQTTSADNSGVHQQLQRTTGVVPPPFTPTSPLIQGASVTGVVSAAATAAAAPQPINPQKTSAATEEKRHIANTHQPLQGASAAGDIFTAAVSDNTDKNKSSNSLETQQIPIDKTEICKRFLKGYCKDQEQCLKAHDRIPYRWEIKKNAQWIPLSDNEAIEKDFCDPNRTDSSFQGIHFDTMTKLWNKVRRIDAGNSVLEPDFGLATEWLWYWEDEFGKWNMYASPDGGHKQADVDCSFLEQRFLKDPNSFVTFKANSQTYFLSFKDMIQKNVFYGTTKLVRRRPRFVSAADVQQGRLSKPGGYARLPAVPDHWDKTQLPQIGYKRVPLVSPSEEYQEVAALFHKTMRGFNIVKIERIQNQTLWDFFQLQKTQMKNTNGGRLVLEKKLFHGTDNKYMDTICHTNFDWRLCGSHGTAYGKGSYFAKNAKYSHSYTSDSDVRSMFVVRLLVGEYTKGSADYRRPPSKDGGDVNFYDSCVDDVHHPSIYVVFDKHQIYPEYLLQYREYSAGIYSTTSVRASGTSQSSLSFQPSQPTVPFQQPPSSFSSNTASSSSGSNLAKSQGEKSCTIS